MTDTRRITLLSRTLARTQRTWKYSPEASTRIIAMESPFILRQALAGGLTETTHDIERIIFDRTITAAQFIELIASLPIEFHGDAIFIQEDGTAVLSARSRGDGRTLHMLKASDVDFYLQMNDLVFDTRTFSLPAPDRSLDRIA